MNGTDTSWQEAKRAWEGSNVQASVKEKGGSETKDREIGVCEGRDQREDESTKMS